MNASNLVLTRMEHETTVLTITPEDLRQLAATGESLRIEICPIRLKKRRARLRFTAPELVTIRRAELETTPA